MPELPEVETIRSGIERLALHKEIVDVQVLTPKVIKPPFEEPLEFASMLIAARFVNARRRGKHLIFGLDSGYALYAHLNMRGQMVLAPNIHWPAAKYLCVVIRFNTGAELRYHDIWTWGELRVLPDRLEDIVKYVPSLGSLGPEPLTKEFTGELLKFGAVSRKGSPIKTVLLDQSVVAGVGNIYADESLFRSRISPLRKAGSLSDDEWQELSKQITLVLSEAVAGGGTLSDNYIDLEGTAGRYSPEVYGRSKMPCRRCNTPLAGSRLSGRSTVYCQKCQK